LLALSTLFLAGMLLKVFLLSWPLLVLAGMHPGIIVLQHDALAFAFSSLVHDRKKSLLDPKG
jgi:hypothetical protein